MPKITVNETIQSAVSAQNTTSATAIAILSTATKGSFASPVLCSNLSTFLSTFGNEAVSEEEYPYGWLAAYECLLRGNPVIFGRLGDSSSAVAATGQNSPSTPVIKLTATTPGTFANNYYVVVTPTNVSTTTNSIEVTIRKGSNTGTIIASKVFNALTANLPYTSTMPAFYDLGTVGSLKVQQATTAGTASNTYTGAQISEEKSFPISGGTNGVSTSGVTSSAATHCKSLEDEGLYAFSIIAAPGVSEVTNESVSVAKILSDMCCGTHYTSFTFNPNNMYLAIVDATATTDSYTDVVSDLFGTAQTQAYTQLGIFYPWYRGQLSNQDATMLVPPSIAYLTKFAESQASGYPCTPVAGPSAGGLTNVVNVTEYMGTAKANAASDLGVNCIGYHRTIGYFIDGNNIYNPSASMAMYRQLSVRNTVNYIHRELSGICFKLSYKLNIPIIKTQFLGMASELLNSLKSKGFIYGYSISLSDDAALNNQGKIKATIKVYPTSALEEFVIDIVVVDTEDALLN